MTLTKKRPQAAATAGADAKGKSRQRFTAKSAGTKDQHLTILAELRDGPKTSYELRRRGCYQCPARILELRRAGHEIITTRVTLVDDQGYSHPRAALYTLVRPPRKKAVQ